MRYFGETYSFGTTEISFNFSHKFRGFYYETLAGTSKSL